MVRKRLTMPSVMSTLTETAVETDPAAAVITRPRATPWHCQRPGAGVGPGSAIPDGHTATATVTLGSGS